MAKLSKLVFLIILTFLWTVQGKEDKRPKRGSVHLGEGKALSSKGVDPSKLNQAFTEVVDHVAPAVVSVNTFGQQNVYSQNQKLWEYFFGVPYDDYHREKPQEEKEIPLGMGSGFIVSEDGYIITNNHVIQNASRVEVTLENKNVYEAEIIGSDDKTDVAVLKISPKKEKLTVLTFGDSDGLKIGEWVLALGNPFGYENTVTTGIVSAKGRRKKFSRGRDVYQNFIQTDAAVNPGNSGGPLVNLKGEVVGINTLIVSQSGGYQGLSFTIPIRMAKKVVEDLIYEGKVIRGFLGVSISDVPPELALALGIPPNVGCKIDSVIEGGPASKAGFKRSDIILKAGDHEIEDASHLRNVVAELSPRKSYHFEVLREGSKKSLKVTLGSRDGEYDADEDSHEQSGEKSEDEFAAAKLGFNFETLNKKTASSWKLEKNTKGVVVTEITNSKLANGLSRGDVIYKVKRASDKNFLEVNDGKKLMEIIKKLKPEESIAFYVLSKGKNQLIGLKAKKE